MTTEEKQGTRPQLGRRAPAVSARSRIIGWILLLVALALVIEVVIAAQVFNGRAWVELEQELVHEGEKLHEYAERAIDPDTGRAHTTAEGFLTSYLGVAFPEHDETMFSLVDGRPSRRARDIPPARLDQDPAFLDTISGLTKPTSGRANSEAGLVQWAVFPVSVEGDPTEAALVVIEFAAPALDRVASTVRVLAVVSAIALAVAGVASWQVAGRVLAPIRTLRQTADKIGESDLDQRIAVTGRDDVAALAHTFNAMLDRLQDAFAGQQQFLDDASHELRTPITVIRGHLELMGNDPEEQQHALALVGDELRRMDRLVDDLMLLARAERPDFLRVTDVEVSDLVMDVLAKASALGERRWGVDGLPEKMVMADEQRLTQALMQLAANAVRHTGVGDRITIGGRIVGDRLLLSVADEGAGIAEEDRVGIFDRFARAGYRGDGGRRGEGAGLGLPIVDTIARAHGGRVLLDSQLGSGSTFTLDIPMVLSSLPDPHEGTTIERVVGS